MNIKNIKINKEQQKIIGVFLIVFFCILILWFVIYIPQRNKLISIKNNLDDAEKQISQITALASGAKLEVVIQKLREQFNDLERSFATNERDIISIVSKEAEKLKITVKNITPAQKSEAKIDSQIQGYICFQLPISMQLTTEYRNLGDYLKALERDLPIIVVVKKIIINGRTRGVVDLDVSLDLVAYFLK